MDWVVIVLRVIHIFAGVFWVGAAWMMVFFLEPTSRGLGAEGGKFMGYLANQRRFPTFVSIAAILAIVAGWLLYIIRYWNLGLESTLSAITLAIGGIIGLVAGGIGFFVTKPAIEAMVKLGGEIASQGKPPTPEQQQKMSALQQRQHSIGLWSATLVSITLFMMAIARYL